MITFAIYEINIKTKNKVLLSCIEAENIVAARKAFIIKNKWHPRKGVELLIKSPQFL
jgi:hypothetical protein